MFPEHLKSGNPQLMKKIFALYSLLWRHCYLFEHNCAFQVVHFKHHNFEERSRFISGRNPRQEVSAWLDHL